MDPSFEKLVPGAVFARDFVIVSPLSSGGMGAVYVAEQRSTGNRRALKLMRPELVANPEQRRRFEQEARIGSRIDSEHVVEVVAAGVDEDTGLPWLAMELLAGEDLGDASDRIGVFGPRDVRILFEQLCHGLGRAHALRIVHRDLKPDNIFLARARRARERYSVKILDFGIAKTLAEAQTKMTGAIGTPLWMAPEQTEAGRSVSPATDVWPLGLIAFRLLSGRGFWRSASLSEASPGMLLREILIDPIPSASQRAAALGGAPLPDGFDAWFARCVAREPAERFPDAAAAFEALAAVLDATHEEAFGPSSMLEPEGARASSLDLGAGTRSLSPLDAAFEEPPPASAAPAVSPSGRRWLFGAGAVVLAGGVVAAVAVSRGGAGATASPTTDATSAPEEAAGSAGAIARAPSSAASTPPSKVVGRTGIAVDGPKGVELFVDGRSRGKLGSGPLTVLDLEPGAHELSLTGGEYYEDTRERVVVEEGALKNLGVVRPKLVVGLIRMTRATPGAVVSLVASDRVEKRIDEAAWKDEKIVVGVSCDEKVPLAKCGRDRWTIRASKPGYRDFSTAVSFDRGAPGQDVVVELTPEK